MLTNDLDRLKDNEDAFNRYKIRPRVMKNVSVIDTTAEIFGVNVRGPGFFQASKCSVDEQR